VVTDADGYTIRTADGAMAADYERSVVITPDIPQILTSAL
jgi:methionine aminopeptidase